MVVDPSQTDWGLLFDAIEQTQGVKVQILNHACTVTRGEQVKLNELNADIGVADFGVQETCLRVVFDLNPAAL